VLVPLLGAHLPSKAQLAELEVQPDAAANTADAVTNAGAAVPEAAAARLVEPP
jgi:hypothetical protein